MKPYDPSIRRTSLCSPENQTGALPTLSFLILSLLLGVTSRLPAADLDLQYHIQHASGTVFLGQDLSTNAGIVVIETEGSLFADQYAGIAGTMDQRGSFAGWLRTGRDPIVQYTPARVDNFFVAFFTGTFTNLGPLHPFFVEIGPWVLYLNDGDPSPTRDLDAFWNLSVKVNGVEQVSGNFQITGHGQGTEAASFHVAGELGTMPHGEFNLLEYAIYVPPALDPMGNPEDCPTPDCIVRHTYGALYTIPKYLTTLDLSGINFGQTFTVQYDLVLSGTAYDVETMAAVDTSPRSSGPYANTPEYGILMKYGNFGRLIQIDEPQLTTNGFVLGIVCEADMYYILLRQLGLISLSEPVAMLLAAGAPPPGEHCTLLDPNPPRDATNGVFYSVVGIPISSPRDTDGDGIDDVYELQHAGVLNPLDGTDALKDADGDGRSNLREYLDGTDPAVADPNPGTPNQLYPALVRDLGSTGDMETADVNNDGFADFVSFSDNYNIQVVLGETNESFLPPIITLLPNTNNYADILLAKFNSDAFMDAAVVDSFHNQVFILLGQADGHFLLQQVYPADTGARRAVTGDFNGDGDADLIVINESAKSLTVLAGNGDGTFQSKPAVTFSPTPQDALLAKFNSDTNADLAVVLASSQVAVLPGNGDGTFGTPQFFATGIQPIRVAAADLNGDNLPDLVTANGSSDDVSILLGNGDGTFQAQTRIATGDSPIGIAIAELNGDTNRDLVISHLISDYHAVLLNNGSGGFAPPEKAFTSTSLNSLLADVDKDGRLDIVSTVGSQIISHGLPNGQFETRKQVIIPRMSPTDFALGDLNADGRLDVLVGDQQSNVVYVVLAQSNGTFAVQNPVPIGRQVGSLATGKFNLGDTLDLAVLTRVSGANSSNTLQILLGDGAGGFVPHSSVTLSNQALDILAGEFNADSQTDLLLLFQGVGMVQPYFGNGLGDFSAGIAVTLGESLGQTVPGDFNGDGRQDLAAIVYDAGNPTLKVCFTQTNGVLVLQQTLAVSSGVYGLSYADLDGDTRPDLLATGFSGPAQLFHGNADGSFQNGVNHPDITVAGGVMVTDVSGDGIADLVSNGLVQRGNGLGGFGTAETYWVGSADLEAQVADLNGDRLPDIVSAGDFADSLFILQHR